MQKFNKILYVNRQKEQELFLDALTKGHYLDIYGITGQGKTFFLKWIHDSQKQYNYLCSYIDLASTNNLIDLHQLIAEQLYDETVFPNDPFADLASEEEEKWLEAFNKGLQNILNTSKVVLCFDNTQVATSSWQPFEEKILRYHNEHAPTHLILITAGQKPLPLAPELRQRVNSITLSYLTETQVQEAIQHLSQVKNFQFDDEDYVVSEIFRVTQGHPLSVDLLVDFWTNSFQDDLNASIVKKLLAQGVSQLVSEVIKNRILSHTLDTSNQGDILQCLAPLRYILPRSQRHILSKFLPDYAATKQPFFAEQLSGEIQKINLFTWKEGFGHKLNPMVRQIFLEDLRLNTRDKFIEIQETLVEMYDSFTRESQGVNQVAKFIEKLYHCAVLLDEEQTDDINERLCREMQSYLDYFVSTALLTEADKQVLSRLKESLGGDIELGKLVDMDALLRIIDDFGKLTLPPVAAQKNAQKKAVQEAEIVSEQTLSRPSAGGGESVWMNLLTSRLLSTDYDEEVRLEAGIDIQDNYRLVESLEEYPGEGDMGVVWKAIDRLQEAAGSYNKFVVIKFLSQDFFLSHPNRVKKLAQEFDRYNRLNHPNLVKAEEVNRVGSHIFIVMGFLQGISLRTIIKNNPEGVSIAEAKPIIQGIANALAYMHKSGITRLDLKPVNIDYDPINKIAKLIDFGIKRTIKQSERERTDTKIEPYMSLETLSGDLPDARDDIYAFACVIYELLSGKHPFKRKTASEAQAKNLQPKNIDGLTVQENKALLRALAFKKEKRTAAIDEFLIEFFPPPPKPPLWVDLFTSALLSEDSHKKSVIEPDTIIRDNYRLLHSIDQGGMGVVWKAVDLSKENIIAGDNLVAIKFVNQKVFKQEPERLKALVHQFHCKGNRYKKIHHAHNIVMADDLDRFGNYIFTVMEVLPGMSLKTLIKAHPKGLPFRKAKHIINSLCQTLASAHKEGLVLLNIEPANIFYDEDQKIVKLIYFDIVRQFNFSEIEAYQSFEALSDLNPDPRDDIYALACVTYELLSGKHPFDRKTSFQAERENLSPKTIKGIKSRQYKALLGGLSFQKKKRTPSVEGFSAAILPSKNRFVWRIFGGIVVAIAVSSAWFDGMKYIKTEPVVETISVPPIEPIKPPVVEAIDNRWGEMSVLLKECKQLYDAKYYTINDSGDDTRTAFLCYQEVLAREPNHAEAQNYLKNMANFYIRLAKRDLRRRKLERVTKWLSGLKKVNPQSPTLAELESKYQSMINDQNIPGASP